MWLRMRQIAGVTSDMEKTEKEIMEVLGVKVGYRDPHIGAAFSSSGSRHSKIIAEMKELVSLKRSSQFSHQLICVA